MLGGYGPGSYFPWVYLQLAIILHFARPLFDRGNTTSQTILWIVICEGFEILDSYYMPDSIHRLLAIRYLFLIYLSWRWVKDGIVINKTTILLSILSGLSISYFFYGNFNNEPFFYTTGWSCHRWPCYFYVSTLLCYLLHIIYVSVSNISFIDRTIKFLAKCSYEIYLVQMAVIAILPRFGFIGNKYLALFLWIAVVWISSLAGGYVFNRVYSNILKRIG